MLKSSNCSIIIIHWNSFELLKLQIEKLRLFAAEIIIVDNASDDFIAAEIDVHPSLKIIQNQYNRGFGAACNQAALLATKDWLLFLNPDVELTTETFEQWASQTKAMGYVASSPRSSSANYKKPLPTPLSLLLEFSPLGKYIATPSSREITLIGGLLLIEARTFHSIGGYDERFFMWFEDSDITQRLSVGKLHMGIVDVLVPHQGGGSLHGLAKKHQKQLFFMSMRAYAQKHFGFLGRMLIKLLAARYSTNTVLPVSNKGLISVVVPNVQKKLLNTFLNQVILLDDLEYIVVTNALSSIELWEYRKEFPMVRWIVLSKPIGFAATVNIGMRAASGVFCATVNDDVIFDPAVLLQLGEQVAAKVGSVNPVILDVNGYIESAGITVLPKGKAVTEKSGILYTEYLQTDLPKTCVADATNGACVVYNKAALAKTGLFNELFGSYLEDIDLSLRMRRAGFDNLVVPSLSVMHYKHQTTGSFGRYKRYLDCKNWMLVIMWNWSWKEFFYNLPAIILERARNIWSLVK